ncbi:tetratricopeptide repeat protein [Thalassotalea ganghwensis]
MSVINQMLKDLDKRQYEQGQGQANAPQVVIAHSSTNKWLVIILAFLLSIAIAVIGWQYLSGYVSSPNQATVSQPTKADTEKQVSKKDISLSTANVNNVEQPSENVNTAQRETEIDTTSTTNNSAENVAKVVKTEPQNSSPLSRLDSEKPKNSQRQQIKPINDNESFSHQQSKPTNEKADPTSNESTNLIAGGSASKDNVINSSASKGTLSISSKQLSAQELIDVKLKQAQQAIDQQQINKAEALFEEVLLLDENQHQARKQLAALWFGRQDYNAAINLLAQGLARDNRNADFRLMMARIYLSQGLNQQAYDVLNGASDINDIEYQTMLASISQQLANFASAQQAYQRLTRLAPEVGRWWLGLAVAYDSDGKFNQARESYQNALQYDDLSVSSVEFIKSRLNELGE